jgi:thiol-disulfide isomerase/thioredoxin
MSRFFRVLLFLVVVAAASTAGFILSVSDEFHDVDAKRVLAARLPDLSGEIRTISDWSGSVLVINFWATWCPPCREEIPLFVRMQQQLGQQGLQFVGIAIDETDKVQRFVEEHSVNYPILIGQLDAVELAKIAGNARGGLPYTLVLDRSGQVVSQQSGALDEQSLRPLIEKLL